MRAAILLASGWLPILLICVNAIARADTASDDAASDAAWWTPASSSPDSCGPQTAGNCFLPGDPLAPVIIENGPCPPPNGGAPCPAVITAPTAPSTILGQPSVGRCDCCGEFSPYQVYLFSRVESWRGVTNGSYPDDSGSAYGANAGFALPYLGEYGFGGQIGGSFGLADLSGKVSPGSRVDDDELETFVTFGIFRRADAWCPISGGIVYDWMFAHNYGVFGTSPTLSQGRGQLGYDLNAWNEIGLWGTLHDHDFHSATAALGTPVSFRGIDQIDVFWDHKFCGCGADSNLYIGVPTERRLAQSANGFPIGGFGGNLGSVILGENWNLPINRRLALYADAAYMLPRQSAGISASGAAAAAQVTWSISFGVNFYLGCSSSGSATVAGNPFMPLLPVADNGTFMVDTDKTE
jgi:hypothetical protein